VGSEMCIRDSVYASLHAVGIRPGRSDCSAKILNHGRAIRMTRTKDGAHGGQQLGPAGGAISPPPVGPRQHASECLNDVEAIELSIGAVKSGGSVLHPIGPITVDHHPGGPQIVTLRQLGTEAFPKLHAAASVDMHLLFFETPSLPALELPAFICQTEIEIQVAVPGGLLQVHPFAIGFDKQAIHPTLALAGLALLEYLLPELVRRCRRSPTVATSRCSATALGPAGRTLRNMVAATRKGTRLQSSYGDFLQPGGGANLRGKSEFLVQRQSRPTLAVAV